MAEVEGPILGTVILAGINPSGEPKYIDGTLLVAGLSASGVAEYIDPDSLGSGGASLSTNNPANVAYAPAPGSGVAASKDDHVHDLSLTNQSAILTADQTLSAADTITDLTGCSVSLVAGVWFIIGRATFNFAGANTYAQFYLTDGSNVISAEALVLEETGHKHSLVVAKVVSPGSTTTYKLRGQAGGTTTVVDKEDTSGATLTEIIAIRIG